jgi:Fic family protein
MFVNDTSGSLVDVTAPDGSPGKAFVPAPLPDEMPALSASTILAVGEARAALAALDSTAAQLPDPTLLRTPTLRREAQATSALEGTYAPLKQVLTADADEPATLDLVEILNYERMANYGFAWVGDGRPITTPFLEDLHGKLMQGTTFADKPGRLRDTQVVIGKRADATTRSNPLAAARFVPSPPGDHLIAGLDDLVRWMRQDHRARVDPVVATAMSHYQLETLHPFIDGNGRLGRLLIVLHLQAIGVLDEPTLTVSPWFEARRTDYYDHLLAVSTRGDWDSFIGFFATGLHASAESTRAQMRALVRVQGHLADVVGGSRLRSAKACATLKHGWASRTDARTL